MDFTFAVRNVGNSPLHDVKVTDDRCARRLRHAGRATATTTATTLLEDGEVWIYTCTMPVPAHATGEMDPLCNVATATGEDEQDKPVSDTDEHCTDIIHPEIAGQEDAGPRDRVRSATPSATRSTSPTPVTSA